MKLHINDKRVLVLGLGDTGLSALRWLHGQGARLSVADTREAPANLPVLRRELPQVDIHLGEYEEQVFASAELIVASPGVAINNPLILAAVQRGVAVVGDIELFALYRAPAAKVIAITGSNGKTTVTTLVGAICRAAGLNTVVAGNIGVPVLDTLMQADAAYPADVYVLELSSFQLETTYSLNADAATMLNLTEDHLDRYDGMAGYAAAKARIFNGAHCQVLNRQDGWSMGMARSGMGQVSFGSDMPQLPGDFGLQQQNGQLWLMHGNTPLLACDELHITGLHNAANALAALALCHVIGLDMAPLLSALREFTGLPHRVQWVAEAKGVAFYDDSKGTNVGATCAALAGLFPAGSPQKAVLIAGGDGKGQDFSPLATPVAQSARAVVLIGRDAAQIAAALQNTGIRLIKADTLEQAVTAAYAAALPGDAVLLSPACASFDMFRNYEHRAEVFVQAVHALLAQPSQGVA